MYQRLEKQGRGTQNKLNTGSFVYHQRGFEGNPCTKGSKNKGVVHVGAQACLKYLQVVKNMA